MHSDGDAVAGAQQPGGRTRHLGGERHPVRERDRDPGYRPQERHRGDGGRARGITAHGEGFGPHPCRAGAVGHRSRQGRDADAEQRRAAAGHVRGHLVVQADEVGDERRCGVGVQLRGRGHLFQSPLVHHRDPVGDRKRLLLVVGDEQGGGPHLRLDPPDLVAQLDAHLGVQCRQRLVEQQHPGFDRQRPGQRHPLLLTSRQLGGVPVGVGGQPDQVEHLRRAVPSLPPAPAAHLEPERDVVEHCQMREQAVRLEHHAHVPPVRRRPVQVHPRDRHRPRRRLVQPRHDPQRGRLPAPGRAQQRHQFTGPDVQGQAVEGA